MEKVVQVPPSQSPTVQPAAASQEKQSVLRSFSGSSAGQAGENKPKMKKLIIPIFALLVVLAGIASGWALSKVSAGQSKSNQEQADERIKESENEAGMENTDQFPDEAEGVLMEGGKEGEGTHYLDRGLGEEKNVYLTSTVINLQNFVGKKVQVWGNTLSAQKVGWLMEVGRVKVVE